MIEGFRNKGLKRFYEDDDRKHLPPNMVERIREILTALDAAETVEGLSRPSFRLHPLKGRLKASKGVLVGHGAGELADHLPVCGGQGPRC
jgi:proteic killer suppression protein